MKNTTHHAVLSVPVKHHPEPITAVAVSDLHCGSRSAIFLPDMETAEGVRVQYSAAQRALYDCWTELTKEWDKPDILFVNGDAIEGQARKESGVPVWSTDLDDQIDCAETLLRMFNAKKHYIIDGTGYHVDAGGKSLESYLGKALNAERIGSKGRQSADELFLKIGAYTFHLSHHIQVGTGWYRTTPLARELVFALLNESHKHRCDVVVRGHVHTFCGVQFSRQRGFTLPCWQLQTRYMRKKSALGMVPDIGAIRFRIFPDEIRVDTRFFKPVETKPKLFVFDSDQ